MGGKGEIKLIIHHDCPPRKPACLQGKRTNALENSTICRQEGYRVQQFNLTRGRQHFYGGNDTLKQTTLPSIKWAAPGEGTFPWRPLALSMPTCTRDIWVAPHMLYSLSFKNRFISSFGTHGCRLSFLSPGPEGVSKSQERPPGARAHPSWLREWLVLWRKSQQDKRSIRMLSHQSGEGLLCVWGRLCPSVLLAVIWH